MKKIIALLSMMLLAASAIAAAPTVKQSGVIGQSSNGYGWYTSDANKVDIDVTDGDYHGQISLSFRKKDGDKTGSLGIATGATFDDITESFFIYNQGSDSKGARYPHTVTKYGYVWVFWVEGVGSDWVKKLTIYSIDDDSWETIDVGSERLAGDLSIRGDVTMKPNGNLVIAASCGVDDDTTPNQAIIMGEVLGSDPLNDEILWADKETVLFKNSLSALDIDGIEVMFGKDGFGVGLTRGRGLGKADDSAWDYGYVYTTDYGDTWVTDWDDSETNMAPFWLDHYKMWENLTGKTFETLADDNSWVGGDFNVSDNNQVMPGWHFDMVVTDKNEIHIFNKVLVYGYFLAGDTESDWSKVFAASDGTPATGRYSITGTFNGSAFTWQDPVFIDQLEGVKGHTYYEEFNYPEPEYPNYQPALEFNMSKTTIGYAGNGVLYTGWLDRPRNLSDCVSSPYGDSYEDQNAETGYSNAGDDQGQYTFYDEAYGAYSSDHGRTWTYDVEASATLTKDAGNLRRGYQLTNTKNIHEEGWCVSKHGISEVVGDEVNLTYYSVTQKPIPGTAPDTPWRMDFCEFEQDMYVWEINVTLPAGMEDEKTVTENFSLNQNYPNPFNPTTSINFDLVNSGKVNLSVFNAKGERVAELLNSKMAAGTHSVDFNGANLNSGVYFYKLDVNGVVASRKMVLTK